jgi:hypothetical protein
MREFAAVEPVPVTIAGADYELLYTFGKVKRIREQLKIDLLAKAKVELDVFTKVLFIGLVSPGELTEEKLDDLIAVPQLPYYIERLQAALEIQTQPSGATKNDSSASPQATGSANPKRRKKPNSGSGRPQLVNGASETVNSGA